MSGKFHVDVEVDGRVLGTGFGKNKKAAEQAAAKAALASLKRWVELGSSCN